MFVLKKKKSNKTKKSTFSTDRKGITESQKKDITKEAHKKALELKKKKENQEKQKAVNETKEHVGVYGLLGGALSIIKGIGGKACGGIFVASNPILIGVGVLAVVATIGYLWLGS